MIHEIEISTLFTLGFFALTGIVLGVRYVVHIFSEVTCLTRGISTGKKGDYYWLNFPRPK
ncbi:MAG: hypothetical protein A3E87_03365 [Gammaproteobacteria bacterium RIFCSPHIGHO2_12_FULL_35_23]|nr:MAG: hypothetical protein A3E87_03365 [Gammaproteobacteria bacterium RIFCSPHIGHO2_12_FULL_35_23]